MSALRKKLEALPPEALVPAGWVLREMAGEAAGAVTWAGTARASEILAEPERQMRRMAVRWEREQAAGVRPRVRVRRKSSASSSHLQLCEEDCWALRRARGPVVLEPVAESGDEDHDIAADIVRRQFG